MVVRILAFAILALALSGCGASGDDVDGGPASGTTSIASSVEECTDRIVERAEAEGAYGSEEEQVRRYVERQYCSRFAQRGWVGDDGTLSIAAHRWAQEGTGSDEACVRVPEEGEPSVTIPCDEVEGGDPVIDCALLHHVRQSEVRAYVEELRRQRGDVECDDGTPLDEVGVQ